MFNLIPPEAQDLIEKMKIATLDLNVDFDVFMIWSNSNESSVKRVNFRTKTVTLEMLQTDVYLEDVFFLQDILNFSFEIIS